MRQCLLIVLLFASLPTVALPADQTILGSQLSVKDPSTPDKRKVVAKAKETGSPNTVVGDPTTSGATLTVGLGGANPGSETYNLPAGISPMTASPSGAAIPCPASSTRIRRARTAPSRARRSS